MVTEGSVCLLIDIHFNSVHLCVTSSFDLVDCATRPTNSNIGNFFSTLPLLSLFICLSVYLFTLINLFKLTFICRLVLLCKVYTEDSTTTCSNFARLTITASVLGIYIFLILYALPCLLATLYYIFCFLSFPLHCVIFDLINRRGRRGRFFYDLFIFSCL